jgi:cytochrome c biogenesis protein CcmG/thiol:disulfide interchange protein DsbE
MTRLPAFLTLTRLRWLAYLVVPAAFVLLLGVGLFKAAPPIATPGSPAPEFEDMALLGSTKTISSGDLEGEPVVLNFWASWCIPCRLEAPALEKAWQDYRNQGVQFVGVNIQDFEGDALAFVKEFGVTYPNIRDVNRTVAGDFGITGLPETFFVDHRWKFFAVGRGSQIGTERGVVVRGAIRPALLRSHIEGLIDLAKQEP